MIKLPIAALVVLIALLGGFYGGYKVGGGGTASAASPTTGTLRTAGNGVGGVRGFAACASPSGTPSAAASGLAVRRGVTGIITNLTSTGLTVHDARCDIDVRVSFDQSVIVRKTVLGQTSDLQDNQTVAVTGTRQSDGTIKANSINIVPAGSSGFGGFGGGAAGASGG